MTSKRSRLWVLVVALALVAAACGDSDEGDDTTTTTQQGATTTTQPGATTSAPTTAAPTPSPDPVTVRAAITDDEDTINPYTYISGFPGWNLLMMQYDSVMQIDSDGIPQPWLASSVSSNADLTEWVVELRDGVTWHDGMPLTANDVKFSYDYFIEWATGRFSRDLRGTESVTVDGNTITIALGSPNPAFDLVALADIPIIPEHIWKDIETPGDISFEISTNVGSGPFKMVDYTPDQFYRFEANPDYFLGASPVDELVVVIFADDAGANAAIRSGEVDVVFERISPEQIELLDSQDPLDISQGPEFTTSMINFDVTKRPFDDVVVRQAMSLGIDRQDLVDTVFLGSATLGSPGWVHPGKPIYNPAVAPTFDPAAANAMLEQAGYTDSNGDGIREFDGQPMSFEMIVNSSDTLRLRLSELVSDMLGDIGIESTVAAVETATWEEAVWPGFDINNGRNYDLAMWGWSAPVQANTIRVGQLVHGDPGVGFLNLTGFNHPEVNTVSEQLATEADPATSAQLIADLQVLIAENLPFIMLAYPDGAYVYNSDVYADWEFIAGQGIVNKLSLLPASARP